MRKPIPALAAIVGTSLASFGQPVPAETTQTLEDVVVTATRTAETVNEVLAPVTVIDRKEIEQSGAQSFRELLQKRAGVQFTNQGGMGKQTNLYLRGTSQQNVKFLVNGLESASATTGTPSFQLFPLAQVERVEVVRGPRSSLYGADAVGGIVQVFTKQGERGFSPFASVSAGSNQTRKARAGVSGGGKSFHYAVAGDRFKTEGFDSYKDREPDDDGFERDSGSLRLGYDWGKVFGIDAHFLHSQGKNEYDWTGFGTPNNETEFVQQVGGVTLTGRPTEFWTTRIKGGRSRDEQQSLADGTETDLFETVRDQGSLQNDFFWGVGQTLTLGADYHLDRVDSSRDFAKDQRWNWGGFAQQQLALGQHDLNLNVRYDENESFGQYTTGSLSWGYRLAEIWRVTASYGSAFRAPTFNELYYPDVGYFKGNPDLDPESSRSADVGLIANPQWGRVEVHAFRTRIEDLITNDCVKKSGGFCTVYAPVNLNEARITGIEVGTQVNLGDWHVATDVTLQDPVNPETGNQLPNRSRSTARVDVNRAIGPVTLGTEWTAKSYKFDDTANTTKVPGYGLLGLYGSLSVGDFWTLRARMDNVFDRDYESVAGYRTRGRYGEVELAYALDSVDR